MTSLLAKSIYGAKILTITFQTASSRNFCKTTICQKLFLFRSDSSSRYLNRPPHQTWAHCESIKPNFLEFKSKIWPKNPFLVIIWLHWGKMKPGSSIIKVICNQGWAVPSPANSCRAFRVPLLQKVLIWIQTILVLGENLIPHLPSNSRFVEFVFPLYP